MQLECSLPFDPVAPSDFEIVPAKPAVFAIFPDEPASQPYLSRTQDLRRRLKRLLGPPEAASRRLNLREVARRIEFQCVGSAFEAQWLLYLLNRFYNPRHFRRRLRLRMPALVKLNLANRFPRCLFTQRMRLDGSRYYGPFPSRAAAERFMGEFLDLFKIRRCSPDLDPDPAHPGCIYSQMHMCLAPCFKGCTDEEYQQEVARVVSFLDSDGEIFLKELEAERDAASERLDFEHAAGTHRRVEKARQALRQRPSLVREISSLHAVLVLPGAAPKSVTFFLVTGGELRGPARLALEANVSAPVSLDQQFQHALSSLTADDAARSARLPPWEHLSVLARWHYSSFRAGELVMLPESKEIPHARLIRLCRKILAGSVNERPPEPQVPQL